MNKAVKNSLQHGQDDDEYDSDDSLIVSPTSSTTSAFRNHNDREDTPVDKYNLIYVIFLIQGMGMLLPWNFFITAHDYFDYKFSGDPAVQKKFENAFSLASMFPNVLSLFINIFLTNKLSRGSRVVTCLGTMFILFTITTILTKVDSQSWTDRFFALTICCVIVINIAGGVFQGTMFGLAGVVGPQYIQGIMSGQAVAGVFAAIADLISKLVSSNTDHVNSAFIYFLIATAVIVITAVSYMLLFKMPKMQFHFRQSLQHSEKNFKQVQIPSSNEKVPYWLIFKQVSPMAFSVMAVFCVTLSMFPAVLSGIESVYKTNGSRWNNQLFPTLVCFLLFNSGDWVGRILAGKFQIASGKGWLLPVLCVSRVVFIPLILMCNVTTKKRLPYTFKSDVWPVVINMFFSLSNGYLGSLCMIYGRGLVSLQYVEHAGTIMSLFLTLGLTLGATISFVF